MLLGREVEQQQSTFGQQRVAPHSPEIIEQGQEHERDVAPASQHAIEVRRQLHHGTRESVECLRAILPVILQVHEAAGHVLHFLGQQRGAVDLHHAQGTLGHVQVVGAIVQRPAAVTPLDVLLQGLARILQGARQLLADPEQSLRRLFAHSHRSSSRSALHDLFALGHAPDVGNDPGLAAG